MEFSEIANRVALIKEKTIDKIDYHFKEYVVMDKFDEPGLDTFIDEMDRYGYWKEVAFEINEAINDFLSISNINYKDSSQVAKILSEYPLLSELYEYKIICDNKLSLNKYYDPDDVQENKIWLSAKLKHRTDNIVPIKLDIKGNDVGFIEKLHSELINQGYIGKIKFHDFKGHFYKSTEYKPIHWLKNRIQFYVFVELLKQGFLDIEYCKKIWVYTCPHFIDRNKNEILPDNISPYSGKMPVSAHPKQLFNDLFIELRDYASRSLDYNNMGKRSRS